MNFYNAERAFEFYYKRILLYGLELEDTLFLNNIIFYIENPLDNNIKTTWRKWKKEYAEYEWNWYLSGNRSVKEIKTKAKIWDKMHNGDDIVNSNYGYQWNRNDQINYVVSELNRNQSSRRAVITIYDGKEHDLYKYDTPCTLNIVFTIYNDQLNMTVMMRSNDLWFGFCNDQYCFSKLQELISNKLNKKIGWYCHFANNLHLYKNKLNKYETSIRQ